MKALCLLKRHFNKLEEWVVEAEKEVWQTANPFLTTSIGFALVEIKLIKEILEKEETE